MSFLWEKLREIAKPGPLSEGTGAVLEANARKRQKQHAHAHPSRANSRSAVLAPVRTDHGCLVRGSTEGLKGESSLWVSLVIC